MNPARLPRGRSCRIATTIPRIHRFGKPAVSDEPESDGEVSQAPAVRSARSWILAGTLIGGSLLVLVIGVFQVMNGSRGSVVVEDNAEDQNPVVLSGRVEDQSSRRGSGLGPGPPMPAKANRGPVQLRLSDRAQPKRWAEPEDKDPIPGSASEIAAGSSDSRRYLPEWARDPTVEHVETPLVVVRRVAEPGATSMKPTLPIALDAVVGGTVYLADQGPLLFDDVHISGSRLIRPRPGYRPILHVERSYLETTRQQSSVVNLERKNITLEGIDMIVNVRDLSSRQTTMFGCAGSSLTIRNCTITVLNPGNAPFTFIRADSSPSGPSRIRLEHSLVRGGFGPGIPVVDFSCNQADLVLDRAVILCGTGPLVRTSGPVAGSEHRVYCIDSVVVGPGPIVESAKGPAGTKTRPIVFRAYGSAFGRLQGPGIASLISSWDADRGADQQADWAGDRNLYAGWKGFFARGNEPTITVGDLAAVRSTWSATERDSQEIMLPWPRLVDLATTAPEDLQPFLTDRPHLLAQARRPGHGLFEKTVGAYPTPAIPEPIERPLPSATASTAGKRSNSKINAPKTCSPARPTRRGSSRLFASLAPRTRPATWWTSP